MKKIIGLILCLALMVSATAFAATIETTGSASVSLSPDTAGINFGIRSFMADVSQALSNVNDRVATIRKELIALGVSEEDMVAADVNIYTNYDYDSNTINGYNVSRQMQITVKDIASIGSIIDKALSAGADELNGINFTSSKQREAYDEALILAVKDALKRAEIIAAAEGIQLKALASVKENTDSWGGVYEYAAASDAAYTSTELDVGELKVSATVTAVYDATEITVE